MPVLTRWYIKLALVYFLAALITGFILVAQPVFGWSTAIGALNPVYFHLFMFGWVTQLIFGVIYWMFPKYSLQQPRGNEMLGWTTLILLNVGLLLRVIGEPLDAIQTGPFWGWTLVISALLQWLAGAAFVANTWSRVKEK
ncbi:MAG: hypothetical protein ACM3PY_08180 [Omnitrophica WOR_2 bacterium]